MFKEKEINQLKKAVQGKYIVLEGIDGVGKTTQTKEITEYLKSIGLDVIQTREVGGTERNEEIRKQLASDKNLTLEEKFNLIYEARKNTMNEVIKPALDKGQTVIADRSYYSTIAYQYCLDGIPLEVIKQNNKTSNVIEPDAVVCLFGENVQYKTYSKINKEIDDRKSDLENETSEEYYNELYSRRQIAEEEAEKLNEVERGYHDLRNQNNWIDICIEEQNRENRKIEDITFEILEALITKFDTVDTKNVMEVDEGCGCCDG